MGKDLKGKELGVGLCQVADGRYLGRYTDAYGKRHNIYGKKLKDVKEKMNKVVYENKMGLGGVESNKITFDELCKMWFEHKLNTVKSSTCAKYKEYYENNIKDVIGYIKITEIKQKHIESIFTDMGKRSNSISTAELVKIILHNIFEFAVNKNLLLINPCKRIELPKSQLKEKAERQILTKEQQRYFIEFAEKENYKYLPIFKLMMLTGARIGEVLALTWNDVDFKNKKIKINKTVAYTKNITSKEVYSIQSPKTKDSKRDIPLCETAIKLLLDHKQQKMGTSDKWVFSYNENFMNYNTVKNSLKRFINKINEYERECAILENREYIPFPEISSHSFRHTFATRCFENGIPPKIVQKYMGHSKLSMTMDLYTHVNDMLLETNIAKINDIF